MPNFTKIRPVGVELFHTDGRTELIVASRNFAKVPKKNKKLSYKRLDGRFLYPRQCAYCSVRLHLNKIQFNFRLWRVNIVGLVVTQSTRQAARDDKTKIDLSIPPLSVSVSGIWLVVLSCLTGKIEGHRGNSRAAKNLARVRLTFKWVTLLV
jgi:hypothetical protein